MPKKFVCFSLAVFLCLAPLNEAWPRPQFSSKQTHSQIASNEETNKALAQERDQSLLKFLHSHELIQSTPEIDIYHSEADLEKSWLRDYFKVYRLEFHNKTNYPIKFTGQIFNRVSGEEARARVVQHQYFLKRKKRRLKVLSYTWLLSSSIVGGFFAPSLVFYRFLQKTITSSIALGSYRRKNNKELKRSLQFIQNYLNEEKPSQNFTLPAMGNHELWYLLSSHPNTDPIILFKSDSPENPKANFYFYSKDLDSGDIREIKDKSQTELINTAFIDGEMLESFEAGIYFIDQKRPIQLAKSDCGYFDYDRSENAYVKIEGSESQNKFRPSTLRLAVQQNIFKHPSRYQISLLKLKINPNDGSRESNGEIVQFALKEIKPGFLEFRSPKRSRLYLEPGNYALVVKNGKRETVVYDFLVI